MAEEVNKLSWFISKKNNYVVVAFSGVFDESIEAILKECEAAIKKTDANCIVLGFHDIQEFDRTCIRPLVQFEKSLREKPAKIRVCFFNTSLEHFLINEGAVRQTEVSGNLIQALTSFPHLEDIIRKRAS